MGAVSEVTAADGLIVAVDAGGSKTEAVALTREGEVHGFRRGPGASPDFEGLTRAVQIIDELVTGAAGGMPVAQANLYISGLDLPVEISAYVAAIDEFGWAGPSTVVANDLFALLRAGTDEPNAIAVICGTGINAVGVRADGADARFAALGEISGDWGGGGGLGAQALWHAARDVDRRGPHTALTPAILARLGASSIEALIEDLHFGRRDSAELVELAPVVLETARAGDSIAAGLVDRQAEEIAAYVGACVVRLELEGIAVPVVLGGGVIRSGDELLLERVRAWIAEVAPAARPEIYDGPPVVGAALLALDRVGASRAVRARARIEVGEAAARSVLQR